MRVLVTGGAGFIGSHVVDSLVARGEDVVVVDDLSTGHRRNVDAKAELVVADIADAGALSKIGGRLDAVVHFASKTKVIESIEQPDLYRRVIIEGTRNVLVLAAARGARVLVNVNSGGAGYGETPVCANEETPVDAISPYGRFKFEAEALLAGRTFRTVSLRLANIYGPRQRSDLEGGVVSIFMGRWKTPVPITIYGDGSAERDYLYVDDVVRATLSAIEGEASGAFNIGTGAVTSVNGLVEAITALAGAPVGGVEHAEARPGELRRACLDPSKARRERFWAPQVELAEGLRLTAAAEGLLP